MILTFRVGQDTYYLYLIANIHQPRRVDSGWGTMWLPVVRKQSGHSAIYVTGAEHLGGLVLFDANFKRAC